MRQYCKAYKLRDLRRFEGWAERRAEGAASLEDDTICYLWDDLTVAISPFGQDDALFDVVTPEWRAFCETTLSFALPPDIAQAPQGTDGGDGR